MNPLPASPSGAGVPVAVERRRRGFLEEAHMTRDERIKRLVSKCPCCRKGLSSRSPHASRNELATAVEAAPPLVALGPDSTDRLRKWGGGAR